jgi:alpha-D-ribose 1-methylphosphonate 5-triphosphate synthase subunit PhnI
MRKKKVQQKLTEVSKEQNIEEEKILKILDVLYEEYLVTKEEHQELKDLASKPLKVPSNSGSNFSDRHYK